MNRSFRPISALRGTRRPPPVLRLLLIAAAAGTCLGASAGRGWSQQNDPPLAEIWYGTQRVAPLPEAKPPERQEPATPSPPAAAPAPHADASGQDEPSAVPELPPLIFTPPDDSLPAPAPSAALPSTWPAARGAFAAPPYVPVEQGAAPASFPSHPWNVDRESEASGGEVFPPAAGDGAANRPDQLGNSPGDAEHAAPPAALNPPIIEPTPRAAEAESSPWTAAAAGAFYFLLGAALGPAVVAFLLVRWFKRSREPLFRVEVINSGGGEATWGWASAVQAAASSSAVASTENAAFERRGAVSLEPPPLALPEEETYDARRRRVQEQQGEQEQEILKQLLEDNLELRRQLGEAPLE